MIVNVSEFIETLERMLFFMREADVLIDAEPAADPDEVARQLMVSEKAAEFGPRLDSGEVEAVREQLHTSVLPIFDQKIATVREQWARIKVA